MLFWALIFLLNSVNGEEEKQFATVRLPSGFVKGETVQAEYGVVNVFRGIPYAEPPLSGLRFSSPHSKTSWSGVFDATNYRSSCSPNVTIIPRANDRQDEDCLYINVYADTRCNATNKCPVVFYVYGGSNVYLSATRFNETDMVEKFASHGIIFVLPAFRRGILGFLDLGRPFDDAPYNVGVYDLLMALRFVQRELPAIGADTKRITGFGHMSGAGILSLLMVSPAVEDKAFERIVLCSPMPTLGPHFNQLLSEQSLDRSHCAIRHGKVMEIRDRLQCLRELPFQELVQASMESNFLYKRVLPQSDDFIFPANTTSALFRDWKPIPMIVTVTKNEMPLSAFSDGSILEACVIFCRMLGYIREATVAECVREYKDTTEHTEAMAKDAFHSIAYMLAIMNQKVGGQSFFSVFTQDGANFHAADLMYLLGLHRRSLMSNHTIENEYEDQLMNDFYPAIFRNFILGSDTPLDGWSPVNHQGRNYLSTAFRTTGGENNLTIVRRPLLHPGETFNEQAVDFWLNKLASVEAEANNGENQPSLPIGPQIPVIPLPKDKDPQFTILFWVILGIACVLAIAVVLLVLPCFSHRDYEE
ncbi:unnamed protein product [Bursaphelenchus xylophilus]|uniref:(pine wood nematode) hypothetical protein n=1 Tax=Bursaphelenchus xylophilus TaxID=6326 RepID=A0A1I7RN22_BURXY|nr:unnamed protein product [Bursaphelenchus xylophilus]CAG9087599.1 unnamed protein product [Bursaphelenchus xylophilus]